MANDKVAPLQLSRFIDWTSAYVDQCRTCGEPKESRNPAIIGPHDHRVEKRHQFVPRKQTKFVYACEKMLAKTESAAKAVNDHLNSLAVKSALTDPPNDENGEILRDAQNRLRYSRKGQLDCHEAQQKYLKEASIVIEGHFVDAVPDNVGEDGLEALTGFILKPETVKAIRAKREADLSDDDIARVKVAPEADAPTGDVPAAVPDAAAPLGVQ